MKMTITFEFDDVLDAITKMLAMNGTKPLLDDKGQPRIHFNTKKKEVTVHCEAAPLPDSCLFCGSGVDREAPTQQDSKTQTINEEHDEYEEQEHDGSQANEGEQEENAPMSLAQLKAQSSALSRKEGPIKHNVQRGAEAHAALARPQLMDGESSDPPFGEGGD
jgi:hypothetical protein